jgi:integrase
MARTGNFDSPSTLIDYIEGMDARLSDRTKQEYVTRLKELTKEIRSATEALRPEQLVGQLRSVIAAGQIAQATFRFYRSAIRYWLGQQAQAVLAGDGDPAEYARAFEGLGALQYEPVAGAPARTSTKKLKVFPPDCVDALTAFAQRRGQRAPNAVRATAFVRANHLVGLRPGEWFDTAFASYLHRDDRGQYLRDAQGRIRFTPALVVQNAKATHGRGNGPRRELLLYGASTEELKALMHFRAMAMQFQARYPKAQRRRLTNLFYRPLNNAIRRALAAAGYTPVTIPACYSTRHQCVADFKASGVSPRDIAAFFGHVSTRTHHQHYGQKRHGMRGVTFRASPESLARVAQRAAWRLPDPLPVQVSLEIEMWAAEQESRSAPGTAG